MSCPAAQSISYKCHEVPAGDSGQLFLTLVNFLMTSRCNSQQFYPTNSAPSLHDGQEFDYIVVGAGSAGSVLAGTLSRETNATVLLVEAGDYPSPDCDIPAFFFSLQLTSNDWQFTTKKSLDYCKAFKKQQCRWPRGKVLGGTGCLNAMLYIRGNKQNYDNWGDGWSYNDVLPIYKLNEQLADKYLPNSKSYGRTGLLPLTVYKQDEPLDRIIKQSAEILGYKTSEEEVPLGYFNAVQNINKGVRYHSGRAFLSGTKVVLSLKTTTNRVLFNENRATGVEVTINGKIIQLSAKKEVVLSAGAISSAQLLQLSGIGPKKTLEQLGIKVLKELPVGKNLQDHLIHFGLFVTINSNGVRPQPDPLDEAYSYFRHKKGEFAKIGITNLLGFINTKNDTNYPNIEFHHLLFPKNDQFLLPTLLEKVGYVEQVAKRILETNQNYDLLGIIPTLLQPESYGELVIKSTDSLVQPEIVPNYLSSRSDVEVLIEAIRYIEKQLDTEPFRDVDAKLLDLKLEACKSEVYDSDAYWECSLRQLGNTIYHPTCTCSMGKSGVVDQELKVHGFNNLRVADASIMPKIISGNTNAAAMMIGRRAAQLIVNKNV